MGFAAADTKVLAIDYDAKTFIKTFKAGEKVVLTYEDQDGNNQNTVSQALTPVNDPGWYGDERQPLDEHSLRALFSSAADCTVFRKNHYLCMI